MVGAPKLLSDLGRMKADVRITCRRCGFEVDWRVADLSAHLIAIGGNLTWSEITRLLVCRRQGCGSTELRATAVPFVRRQANLPRRIGKLDEQLIAAAMKILDQAVARSPGRAVATPEVRLALLVTYVYMRDAEAVRAFSVRAGDTSRSVSTSLHDALGVVRQRLIERGWLAPEPVVDRVPTWPWQSPAPPGWRERPNPAGRDEAD